MVLSVLYWLGNCINTLILDKPGGMTVLKLEMPGPAKMVEKRDDTRVLKLLTPGPAASVLNPRNAVINTLLVPVLVTLVF